MAAILGMSTGGRPRTLPTPTNPAPPNSGSTNRKGFYATNFFGGSPLNRLSHLRSDEAFIAGVATDERARYLVLDNLRFPLVRDGEIAWLSHKQLSPFLPVGENERVRVFLGVEDDDVPYWAVDVTGLSELSAWMSDRLYTWAEARPAAFRLSARDAAVLAQGRALVDWNLRYAFCSACGTKTASADAGYKRRCLKEDCIAQKGVQNFAYPRTDPVAIVCIINKAGDRVLLGRQKAWPPKMYSCIAGFVECGESLEEAVRREAWEETNIRVGKVAYHSSQPWPFPSQLMFGCIAQAETEEVKLEDKELEDARWFTKEEVAASLADTSPMGSRGASFWMPAPYAIAHTIVKAWALEGFKFTDRPEESSTARM